MLLVKILNCLGVCASADTLSRFIQYKVSTFRENKMKGLSPDSFTVVSSDNIDFMHSFARVFCGHQTSSWHGRTVQAIQPLPSLSAHETRLPSNDSPCPNPASDACIRPSDTCTGFRLPSRPVADPSLVEMPPSRTPVDSPPVQMGFKLPVVDPSLDGMPPSLATVDSPPGFRLQSCPVADPSLDGMPPSHPTVDPCHVGTYTEFPTCTCASNDPKLSSQPLEVFQVTRKRTERSSLISSSINLTRSPLPKVQRRLRTGTE